MIRALLWPAALVLCAALAACSVDSYCLDCATDDAGGGFDGGRDGGVDAGDGGGGNDACIDMGLEVCNGQDEDCDGSIDEEAAMVGEDCTDPGICGLGVYECLAGELTCTGTAATPEECDDIDNDCDGDTDEGNPEGGQMCGSDVGECIGGFTQCTAGGVLDCVGDVGVPGTDPEICDGKDNDCDASFDEDVPTGGDCGFPAMGLCVPGVLTCVGGGVQCVGGQGPTFELCDTLDQDCDGDPINGYDLDNDVRNCGACNNSCIGTIPNATEACVAGDCAIASCDPGFHDDPDVAGPDCGYACDFQGPIEACNNADDDCDGTVDENVTAPPICDQDGACAGTVATCTPTGFDCVYPAEVSVDGDGNIEPENECDDLDNDCDGQVDEGHADLGDACLGAGMGICQDRGHRQCDSADPDGPTICVIDDPGETAEAGETCDLEDDDCDGAVDEGASTGAIQEWVSIGGGHEIMKYEASRPDARAGITGNHESYVCSRAGVQPWTNVSHPDAEAACASIGARLCSEQEWHRACSQVTGTTYPILQAAAGDAPIFIEAEDYFALVPVTDPDDGVLRTWVPDTTAGYSGISGLRASPNTGAANDSIDAVLESPRLDYQIEFQQTGTHYVWIKGWGPRNADDILHVGLDGVRVTSADNVDTSATAWTWFRRDNGSNNNRITISVTTAGTHTLNVWMGDDGVRIDALYVTRNNTTTAPTDSTTNGGDWSFATDPDVYVGTTCNGVDNGADVILDTGAKLQCNAGGVFDLSGNVKEWTLERLPAANPIRGGAYNNLAQGISCGLSFTLADDDFFFSNVGFRCCR